MKILCHALAALLGLSIACAIRDCQANAADVAHVDIVGEIKIPTVMAVGKIGEKLPPLLDVRIDSPGGSSESARAIVSMFHTLQTAGTRIRCTVTGKAMSAAFWILQACDDRIAVPSAQFMIHEPLVFLAPSDDPRIITLATFRTITAELEADLTEIVIVVAPRLGLTDKAFRDKILNKEWRMSAQDALSNHAIDSIAN